MAIDPKTYVRHYRRYLRFNRYLPVECTVLDSKQVFAGVTRCVNAGGLEVLLSEPLPVDAVVSARISQGDPISGRIVSVGNALSTVHGLRFPHGIAFEVPVEPSIVRQWISQPQKRTHQRGEIQFAVEYSHEGTTDQGTCLNLCKGGIFIATNRPLAPGTELLLRFTLPDPPHPISVQGRVKWMTGMEKDSDAIPGMGVQFLNLDPAAAEAITALVDRLFLEACPQPNMHPTSPTPQ